MAETKDNRFLFEEMPVPEALTRLAVPTVIGQLILLFYNLADTFFIGRTGNPYMIAAASLILPLYSICIAIANLFGVGGGSLISRLMGQKRGEEAARVCSFSFYGAIITALAFSAAVYLSMRPLLYFLGASGKTYEFAREYTLYTTVIGAVPAVLTIAMANLFRSVGLARKAAIGSSTGCLLNVALDPLFMFVILPKGMEIQGAAAATMLSNVVSMLYFIFQLAKLKGTTVLSVNIKECLPGKDSVAAVFAVGIPSALTMFLYEATNIVIDKLASTHGDIPVAAIGIVLKAERIPLNIGVGICQAMMPLVAYNYTSGNHVRMRSVMKTARTAGIVISIACIVMYELLAGGIMRIFINDPQTVALGIHYMRARCLASVVMFMCFNYVFFFEAVGKGSISFTLAVIRQLVFTIPILLLMNSVSGMNGIIWTQFIADGCTALVSFIIYRKTAANIIK